MKAFRSRAFPDRAGMRDIACSYNGQACILSQFADITELKQLEASLRLTAAAVEQSAEAMVILDKEGVILSVNPAFTRVTGHAGSEAVPARSSLPPHSPSSSTSCRSNLARASALPCIRIMATARKCCCGMPTRRFIA